jgi:HK97 family phage major capsid protein
VAGGAEITPSDATLAESVVVFKKLAGITIVSNEMVADASPEAAGVVGDGLARDLARKLEAAFFANTTTNGPSGLLSITPSTVDKGSSWTKVDPFTEAVFTAANQGAPVTRSSPARRMRSC